MFCLDYALSFVCFTALRDLGLRLKVDAPHNPAFALSAGAMSGLLSAGALYPFDFVRHGSLGAGRSSFAWSSVPFSAVYLGMYFSCRDADSVTSRVGWSLASAAVASTVELPFDHTKRAIAGSGGRAAAMAAARVPLGALLLFAFDGILTGQPATSAAHESVL